MALDLFGLKLTCHLVDHSYISSVSVFSLIAASYASSTTIYKDVWFSSTLPDIWKIASVVPVF
jgi:hypothetical protein